MELSLKENLDLLSNNASSRTVNGVGSITLERAQGFFSQMALCSLSSFLTEWKTS